MLNLFSILVYQQDVRTFSLYILTVARCLLENKLFIKHSLLKNNTCHSIKIIYTLNPDT